jgi:hypothetical protein
VLCTLGKDCDNVSQLGGTAMKRQKTEQKITIKSAAQILGVSTKSIQRYLAKGRLTRIKEGTRTLVLLAEVKALEDNPSLGQGRLSAGAGKIVGMGQVGDTVTLGRERYEQMLLELGELRTQNQFFLEFKGMHQAREEAFRNLEREVELLGERVRALEMRRQKEHPGAPGAVQEPASGRGPSKAKQKKPWWQV